MQYVDQEAIRTSSPLEVVGGEGGDVARTARRKRVLSAIAEESPVAPAAAAELPSPSADIRDPFMDDVLLNCPDFVTLTQSSLFRWLLWHPTPRMHSPNVICEYAISTAEENDLTMTPRSSGDFFRARTKQSPPVPPPATTSSSANCSFDEAGSGRTSLSRHAFS